MTEKKIDVTDLSKALSALQDLAKGHSSGGTATTKVETMVGESGSTQLFHTASNSDPGSWAGSSWRGEGWEDMIEANGTDMGAVRKLGKSIAKEIQGKLTKGQPLSAREVGFVSKGGMNFLAAKDDDKAEKACADDKDMEKAHGDEEEDKKLIAQQVKPSAMKKSMLDHAAEEPAVAQGFEVAEFLAGWAQVMHKSQQSSEARIISQVTDRLLTALAASDAEAGAVSKSMAGALASLGEVLAAQAQRLDQLESGAARAPKSTTTVAKSGAIVSPNDAGDAAFDNLSKAQVSERLLDLVKKSEATSTDVLRYDATGEISDDLRRKVSR